MNEKEKKDNGRGYRVLIIFALIIAIFCLSIGYSAYSQVLEINTKTAVSNNKWLIEFNNVSEPIIVGSAYQKTPPHVSSTMINLDVELDNAEDSISYTFDVENNGNIDAKLSSIPTITGIADAIKDDFLVTITYSDGTAIQANDLLESGTEKTMKLHIAYRSGATITDQTIETHIILLYVQA